MNEAQARVSLHSVPWVMTADLVTPNRVVFVFMLVRDLAVSLHSHVMSHTYCALSALSPHPPTSQT